ncbi:G patch domain-containing protein 4 isoform X2 [Iris pallida]|uniref:G patch domain-containing protein 4 isoform X2 n=1 Tax=Iris pallida TaxID=29817 RepID=A0AAX6EP81_IRIPA|nr:G patch domain-containing protein 4 isoform X2 [Iris pallida]
MRRARRRGTGDLSPPLSTEEHARTCRPSSSAKKSKKTLEKKSGGEKGKAVDPSKDGQLSYKVGHTKVPKHTKNLNKLTNSALSSRKRSRKEKGKRVNSGDDDQLPKTEEHKVDVNDGDVLEDDHAKDSIYAQTSRQIGSSTEPKKTKSETKAKPKKIKKDRSRKKKDIQMLFVKLMKVSVKLRKRLMRYLQLMRLFQRNEKMAYQIQGEQTRLEDTTTKS